MKKAKRKNGKKIRFPWQKPKSKQEDPNAPKQVAAIMKSPSYQLLEENISFIASEEARGIRLQLDYLRVESKLKEYGIDETIVVFGSARTLEYQTAVVQLQAAEKKLKAGSDSADMMEALRQAERRVEQSVWYGEARKLGRLIGESGKGAEDCHVTLMTGGGPGIMEAANRGAFDVGAKSIGLNIELPHEQFPNPYITPDLCFQFHYFAIRKFHFLQRAKAIVVFPGGFGTLDELFEILTLTQTQKADPIPLVFVSASYWKRIIDFDFLIEEGMIAAEDMSIFTFVESAEAAWKAIKLWHKQKHKA